MLEGSLFRSSCIINRHGRLGAAEDSKKDQMAFQENINAP